MINGSTKYRAREEAQLRRRFHSFGLWEFLSDTNHFHSCHIELISNANHLRKGSSNSVPNNISNTYLHTHRRFEPLSPETDFCNPSAVGHGSIWATTTTTTTSRTTDGRKTPVSINIARIWQQWSDLIFPLDSSLRNEPHAYRVMWCRMHRYHIMFFEENRQFSICLNSVSWNLCDRAQK